ncbi:Intracellular endo-alpha-(1-_5)-L-arabinanase [Aquisphaera giovannonii]|uniref:Intracellular endo-alpha-(1->5)-L-arabinanase n=1 Tax=Aquisphaera giovannonii TaxID=406548 RepID=A0A5B9W1G8_9BACT|nr:arabinan endo-1,5-alpha-L-arabinosidase [Aquisphaera giovannonii]QEH34436.1 Intracellular endo-alpha-(1->5)-L-arabinanase [Aquisphaera giovannonii]
MRRLLTRSIVLLITSVGGPVTQAQVGDATRVHDPCIIKEGEWYYVFSTGPGIPIRRSRDLKTWARDGRALDGPPGWAKAAVPAGRDLWAPDISLFGGKFHLYYSISTFGKNRSCIGLATNRTLDRSSPDYRWVDEGLVIASEPGRDDFNAIDPDVVLDEEGTRWLSFGSFWGGVQLVRLDRASGKPAGAVSRIAARPEHAIEAPYLYRRGGFYYLFASFDRCCQGVQSTYKIMVGRSRKVDGPYVDDVGKPMLEGGGTLVLEEEGRYRGPGHNAILRDGAREYLVHHAYDAEAFGRPTLQIRPLTWTDAGWPKPGAPIAEPENPRHPASPAR